MPNRQIFSQIPKAGALVPKGTAIAVFLEVPATTTTTSTGTGTTATGTGTGTAATTSGTTTTAIGTGTGTGTGTTATSTTATSTTATTTTSTTATNTQTGTVSGTTAPGGLTLAQVAREAGKGPIAIPALTGSATNVSAALSQLGLEPQTVSQLALVAKGQVAGTVPAVGSKVAKGAQVDVLVSSGSPDLAYDNGTTVSVLDPSKTKPAATVAGSGGGAAGRAVLERRRDRVDLLAGRPAGARQAGCEGL